MAITNLNEQLSQDESKEIRELKKSRTTATLLSVPGLILWEYNEVTKQLDEAKFEYQTVEIANNSHQTNVLHKVIQQKKNCIYFQALNKRNAIRKVDCLLKGL